MRGLRRYLCGRPLGHGLAVALALVSYLTAAVGCPLPTLLDKDRSQPFPCQGHVCGCHSAEACWRHCCCFTPHERLAWAEEHHVEPPAYAEKPRPEEQSSCCYSHDHSSSACHTESSPFAKDGSPWLFGVAALRCHGLATQWIYSGAASPPPLPLGWSPGWPLVECLPRSATLALAHPLRPPDPPPRSFPD